MSHHPVQKGGKGRNLLPSKEGEEMVEPKQEGREGSFRRRGCAVHVWGGRQAALDGQTCQPASALRDRLAGTHTHTRWEKDAITKLTSEIKLTGFYMQVPNSALGNLERYSNVERLPNRRDNDNSALKKNKCICFCSSFCLEDGYWLCRTTAASCK